MNIKDEESIEFRSLSPCWTSSSPTARTRSLSDSHEDFEFAMSHVCLPHDSSNMQAVGVASAEKLFFRGQILPLQSNAKLQAPQKPMLPSPASDAGYPEAPRDANALLIHHEDCLTLPPLNQGQMLEVTLAKGSLPTPDLKKCVPSNEEISTEIPLQWRRSSQAASLHASVMQHSNEEDASAYPCRTDATQLGHMEEALNFFPNESPPSSFRSQASFWSCTEKEWRDSSSSSRCSKGSNQESVFFQGARKRSPQKMSMQGHASHFTISNPCPIDPTQLSNTMDEFKSNHPHRSAHMNHLKPPWESSLSSTKWSWKALLAGLQKASRLWLDAGGGRAVEREKRAIFTFTEIPGMLNDPRSRCWQRETQDWEWHSNSYDFVSRERSVKKPGQGSQKHGKLDGCKDHQVPAIFCLRREARQEASFDGGGEGRASEGQGQMNIWNAKERWRNRIRRVKKSAGTEYETMKAKSLGSTPLAKSPVRRGNLNAMHMGTLNGSYSSLPRGTAAAAAARTASCPASIRSSPHHSGLLAVVNNMASPDLHSAIQGAIAHCKQSQALPC